MNKTLLYHDTFLMKWGAERMNIEIAKLLDADIATAIWSKDCYNAREMWFLGKIAEVDPGFTRWMYGFIRMKFLFLISLFSQKIGTLELASYKRIIFSNESISAIWWVKKDIKTMYYAHSISRHLFDQYDLYLSKVPLVLRPFYMIFAFFLRSIYIREVRKIGTVFVNSIKNQERMKEWIGRSDSIVLSPPVDTHLFREIDTYTLSQVFAIEWIPLSHKDYYLSFSRLTHAKRIDVIIEAFKQMPDKKVLILYGKNDSQREEFMNLAHGYDNIVFRVLSENKHLPHIINSSIASIAISKEEDFGMVTIESLACGIPVLAVNSWWYRETMKPWITGFLIPEDWLQNNIVKAINFVHKDDFIAMKLACIRRSETYSLDLFKERFMEYIK